MTQESEAQAVEVRENVDEHRFEAHVGDRLAGVLEYRAAPGKIVALHTEVTPEFEGRGVASRLVAGAFGILRGDGRLVEPQCPYVRSYLERHPEDGDLVASG